MNTTSSSAFILETQHLTRVLPGVVPVTLVEDISIQVPRGRFVSITGPSGSGKSSLLYLLGLLDTPTSGQVILDGTDTGPLDSNARAKLRLAKLGFVFQFHFLLPELRILENVMAPMRKLEAMPIHQMREKALHVLDQLGLADQAKKLPEQLSGGQRQRVALARALANDPLVILADEPTGNLDSKNAQLVFDIFRNLVDAHGATVVAVTHDEHFAAHTDERLHLIDGHIVS